MPPVISSRTVEPSTVGAVPSLSSDDYESKAPPTPRPATIYDVAARAQVSHQTVSRYLRGYNRMKPDALERVERALQELNYRPNASARALALSRSRRIGAIVYGLEQSAPQQFVVGAGNAARDRGYYLDIVGVPAGGEHLLPSAIESLAQSDLAGLLTFAPTVGVRRAVQEARFTIPVWIETENEEPVEGPESTLNAVGVRFVLEHLLELGHQRIAYLPGPDAYISARNRRTAYRRAMNAAALPTEILPEGDWTAASGHRVITQGFTSTATALVCANDQMAMGALLALHRRGIAVPADLSVVGFDDVPEAAYTIPPLTTVRVEFALQGRSAVDGLIDQIEGGETPGTPSTGQPARVSLAVRDSSAPPAPA